MGNSVTFSIKENPSTGYSWQFDNQSNDGIFMITGEYKDLTPPAENETIIGEDGQIAET